VRKWWGTIAAAAVLLLAAWEIGVLAHAKSATPSDNDWSAAADAVRAEKQPGDLIVFAPRWVDPIGRMWLGDAMSVDDVARMDAARFSRIWEVSIRGARAPETRGLGKADYDHSFGRVRVRRFVQEPAKVTWSFGTGPNGDVSEVAHEPHQCTHLRPGPNGSPLRRPVRGATLGSKLVVYAGIADVWERRDNKAWADLVVFVDGREVTHALVGNTSGWLALPVAETTPGPHEITFQAEASKEKGDGNTNHLDLCVSAEGRE
jgi:hypothetical protein